VIWTIGVGISAKFGLWDSVILACWLAWPIVLVAILIRFREKNSRQSIWRFTSRNDFLLVGALLPLAIGQAAYNISVTSNINSSATFTELALFIGFYSVALWGVTGFSVFVAYLSWRFFTAK
jgi:hypothetical protein